MTLRASRWLITVPADMLREAQYLDVFEDDTIEWSSDPQRALRFARKHEAERFGANHALKSFYAQEWSTAELVDDECDEHDIDGVDDDLEEAA